MISDFDLYAWMFIWVVGMASLLVASALVVGWWGKRKALREGRYCPDCGAWDDAAEILIHRINEHWNG